jgi:molybdopterin molybdotransferase
VKRQVTAEELARPLIGYREAVERIVGSFQPLPPVDVPLHEALGLAIAEDVVAMTDVPGFDNSAMDGFAVRADDTADAPVSLRVVDDIPAGTVGGITVQPGTCTTIMTGAPVPEGADTVVPWEDTERDGDSVTIKVAFSAGRHVRPRAEDVRAGDQIIAWGVPLGPVHLGVLASIGRTRVRAHPAARVAILSTGDELAAPGAELAPGQVYDANRAVLRAMCERAGARVVADALIADDPDAIAGWLRDAASAADLIITTGGASVGEHDWIRAILEQHGELQLWRIAIKPGKPVAFGAIGGTRVLGLPGNPGSAFVGAHVFVQPSIRALGGRTPAAPAVTKRLASAVKGSPSRTQFTRVRIDGELAVPLPAQSSVVLSNLLGVDGFAIVEAGGAPEGAEVTVELLT